MPEDIKIAIQLVDNISKELEALNKKIDKFGTDAAKNTKQAAGGFNNLESAAMSLVKGLGALYIGKKAGEFLLSSAKAAGEAEKAIVSLNNALKSQNVFTQQAAEYYIEYASRLQIVKGIQDEVIMSAQALAIRYGYLGAANSRLINGAAELSSQLGMDLNSAVMLLVRSMSKENDELGRLGLKIEGASGSSERFNSIMGEVEKKFSGASAANLQGYAGAMTQLNIALDELKEFAGSPIAAVLTDMAKAASLMFGIFTPDKVDTSKQLSDELQNQVEAYRALAEMETDPKRKAMMEFQAKFAERQLAFVTKQREESRKGVVGVVDKTDKEIQEEKDKADKKREIQEKLQNDIAQSMEDAAYKEIELNNELNERLKKGSEERWQTAQNAAADEWAEKQNLINEEQTKLTEFNDNRKRNEEDTQAWLKQQRMSALEDTIGNALALTSMFKDNSKEMFAMTKALSIAQATMNTYKGATAALDYPPPFSFIAAAAQIAFGLAQVAQIASTPFKAAALGADFVTSGREMLMVGDNPGGKERVQVTPLSSPNINGTKNINQTKIVPVLIIKGGNIVDELERASISNEIDWERILPREVMNAR